MRLQSVEKICRSMWSKKSICYHSNSITKHLATFTQFFNMPENDLEQLASFMRHTVEVHSGNYRLLDGVYQTARMSKLLILMEEGQAAQFRGKSLTDIDLNLEEDLMIDNDKCNKSSSLLLIITESATSELLPEKHGRIQHENKRVLV